MFCFCSNEMQLCRIWGAKQKLNPITNSQSPISHILRLYTLHFKLFLYIPLERAMSCFARNSCWLMLLMLLLKKYPCLYTNPPFTLFLRQFLSIILSIIVNFFNKNTPSLKATKIYKNQVVMFCFCSK